VATAAARVVEQLQDIKDNAAGFDTGAPTLLAAGGVGGGQSFCSAVQSRALGSLDTTEDVFSRRSEHKSPAQQSTSLRCLLLPIADLHYCDGGPMTAQYLLVVDALNFCFWYASTC
jgi:hypothetical protein